MALTLTRTAGETLHIGPNIVIRVHKISGSRVKLIIEAPPSEKILRGELVERKSA